MNAADQDASSEPRPERATLIERLRAVFGMGSSSLRQEIEEALRDAAIGSEFSAQERLILKNVLGLHDARVEDIMVPRADIIAVGMDTPLADVLAAFRVAGHSRLPVYGETLDDLRGMVHIRDFVDYLVGASRGDGAALAGSDSALLLADAKIVRPVLFVPPSMPALDLLPKMQASRTHMALVIDEYGGTDGLVSIEDVVEMIVGDIEDEHDSDDSPRIEAAADGTFVVDARADLADASAAIGEDLAAITDAEDVDTLGGLVTAIAGRVPVRGEVIAVGKSLEIEVLDADPRRVKRVRIRMPGPETGPAAKPGPAVKPAGKPGPAGQPAKGASAGALAQGPSRPDGGNS